MKDLTDVSDALYDWAKDRNLLKPENISKQFMKMVEEVGEVSECITKNRPEDLPKELGDVFVTLVILSYQNGLDLNECAIRAFEKIKNRKGKTVNGTFVKEEDLKN